MAWLAWVALAGGLLTGPAAWHAGRTPAAPLARHFPGQPPHPGPRRRGFLAWVTVAVTGALAVLALTLLDAPVVSTIVGGAVTAVVLGGMSVRMQSWANASAGVQRAIDAHAPRVAVVTDGTVDVGRWMAGLRRSGIARCLVAADAPALARLARRHPHPVAVGLPPTVHSVLHPFGGVPAALPGEGGVRHVLVVDGPAAPAAVARQAAEHALVAVPDDAVAAELVAHGVPASRLRVIGEPAAGLPALLRELDGSRS